MSSSQRSVRELFLRGSVASALHIALAVSAALITYGYLARTNGLGAVAVWGVCSTIAGLARIGELGVPLAITRRVAQDRSQLTSLCSSGTVLVAITSGIACLVALGAGAILITSSGNSTELAGAGPVLGVALLQQWVAALAAVWLAPIDGVQRVPTRVGVDALGIVSLMCSMPILIQEFGAGGLALASLIQALVVLLAARGVVFSITKHEARASLIGDASAGTAIQLVRFGAGFQTGALLHQLMESIPSIALARGGYVGALASFETARRLPVRLYGAMLAFTRSAFPLAARDESNDQPQGTIYTDMKHALFLIAPLTFGGLIAVSQPLGELWLATPPSSFGFCVGMVALGYLAVSVTGDVPLRLLASGRTRAVALCRGAGAGATLVFALFGWGCSSPATIVVGALAGGLTTAIAFWLVGPASEQRVRARYVLAPALAALLIPCLGWTINGFMLAHRLPPLARLTTIAALSVLVAATTMLTHPLGARLLNRRRGSSAN